MEEVNIVEKYDLKSQYPMKRPLFRTPQKPVIVKAVQNRTSNSCPEMAQRHSFMNIASPIAHCSRIMSQTQKTPFD